MLAMMIMKMTSMMMTMNSRIFNSIVLKIYGFDLQHYEIEKTYIIKRMEDFK